MAAVLLLLDGAADEPVDDLGGQTPLQAADLTTLHRAAAMGTVGWGLSVPNDLPVNPEISVLEILGYESRRFYPGRSALRAQALGIPVAPGDAIFSVTFLATDGERILDTQQQPDPTVVREFARLVTERLTGRRWHWFVADDPPLIFVLRQAGSPAVCRSPEQVAGALLKDALPQGDREEALHQLIYSSLELLDGLEFNKRRSDEGLPPVNLIWFYEEGRAVTIPSLVSLYGPVRAEAWTDHQPMIGLFTAIGVKVSSQRSLIGAEEKQEEDELVDGERWVRSRLAKTDLLILHFRDPDRAGHQRDPERKIYVLRRWQEQFLNPFLNQWVKVPDGRLMVLCTHRTSCRSGRHERGEVPFLLLPRYRTVKADEFHEAAAKEGGLVADSLRQLSAWLFPSESVLPR
ncbi:MAG: hypothetical protein NZ959_11560 [Armatimonadetes bacterium]|nr:hypothetical protein [Armatimonadota bacterium]MDW8121269.1 hypothetical protein [Armatimonadota bacterium]